MDLTESDLVWSLKIIQIYSILFFSLPCFSLKFNQQKKNFALLNSFRGEKKLEPHEISWEEPHEIPRLVDNRTSNERWLIKDSDEYFKEYIGDQHFLKWYSPFSCYYYCQWHIRRATATATAIYRLCSFIYIYIWWALKWSIFYVEFLMHILGFWGYF